MDIQINAIGALCALAISIFLILKKVPPAYGMMIARIGRRLNRRRRFNRDDGFDDSGC
jgi:hypothetical protein